jgi:hypothetical protein
VPGRAGPTVYSTAFFVEGFTSSCKQCGHAKRWARQEAVRETYSKVTQHH